MTLRPYATDRRSEIKLPKPDDYFRLFISQAPVAMAMFDRDMRYIAASRRWLSDYGLEDRDLSGQLHYDIFPDLPERWRAVHRRGLDGEIVSAAEDRFDRADGTTQWLRWEVQPWYSEVGQGGIIIFSEDITERKNAEVLLQSIIEAAPIGLVMCDTTGSIVLTNAEIEKLFGYPRNELQNKKIDVLVPDRHRGVHVGHRVRFFASPTSRSMGMGQDLFGLRKDGSEFPVEIGLSPVKTNKGLFVLATAVDISKRMQRAEELRRSNEELTERNLELQRFAYIASHDLQSPLRSICGFVQALKSEYKDRLDEQANDWIQRTVQSTEHLQALIADLATYSRIDSHARSFQRVALSEVFNDAVLLLDASIRESGAKVTCDELPVVMGERSQLVQLLVNLIDNGIKYRGASVPVIHVSAKNGVDNWIVSVRDNGIGIDPKHHEKIFDVFQRLHGQHEYPGTGIGLAICRRVIDRHGGKIWVESRFGHGSVFQFTIPKQADKIHEQRTAAQSTGGITSG